MSDLLQEHLSVGHRYLVVELITGTARVGGEKDVFQRRGGAGLVQFVVVDLAALVEQFDQRIPDRAAFTLTEVAELAGEKGPTVNAWVQAELVSPSIRDRDGTRGRAMIFDRTDAFVICLLASLRRKCGLELRRLRNVSRALRERPATNTPKGKPRSRRGTATTRK